MRARIAVLAVLVVLFAGCSAGKHMTVETPVYIHDTTVSVKVVHDTCIIERFRTVTMQGDTIKVVDSIRIRDRMEVHDTLQLYAEQPVVTERAVVVEKELGWWQRLFIGVGILVFVVGILWLAVFIYKKVVRRT